MAAVHLGVPICYSYENWDEAMGRILHVLPSFLPSFLPSLVILFAGRTGMVIRCFTLYSEYWVCWVACWKVGEEIMDKEILVLTWRLFQNSCMKLSKIYLIFKGGCYLLCFSFSACLILIPWKEAFSNTESQRWQLISVSEWDSEHVKHSAKCFEQRICYPS